MIEQMCWAGYFGFSQLYELRDLDSWVRRRLRCVAWVQWKTWPRRFAELHRRGVPRDAALRVVGSPKGPWRLSCTHALNRALSAARFKRLGLLPMASPIGA